MRSIALRLRSIRLRQALTLAGVLLIASVAAVGSLRSSPVPAQDKVTAILLNDGFVVCSEAFADLLKSDLESDGGFTDIDEGLGSSYVRPEEVVGVVTVSACPQGGITADTGF